MALGSPHSFIMPRSETWMKPKGIDGSFNCYALCPNHPAGLRRGRRSNCECGRVLAVVRPHASLITHQSEWWMKLSRSESANGDGFYRRWGNGTQWNGKGIDGSFNCYALCPNHPAGLRRGRRSNCECGRVLAVVRPHASLITHQSELPLRVQPSK